MRLRFVHLVRVMGGPNFDSGDGVKVIFWRWPSVIFCTMTNQKIAQELSLIIDKVATVSSSKKYPLLTLKKAFYFIGQTAKEEWFPPCPLAKFDARVLCFF
jgi:hypothetical protein